MRGTSTAATAGPSAGTTRTRSCPGAATGTDDDDRRRRDWDDRDRRDDRFRSGNRYDPYDRFPPYGPPVAPPASGGVFVVPPPIPGARR